MPYGYWTVAKAKAVAVAEKHANRSSLCRHEPGAYACLKRANMLDEVFGDYIPRRRKWTYSAIAKIVDENRLSLKADLQRISPTAYRAAYRSYTIDGVRWIDAIFGY